MKAEAFLLLVSVLIVALVPSFGATNDNDHGDDDVRVNETISEFVGHKGFAVSSGLVQFMSPASNVIFNETTGPFLQMDPSYKLSDRLGVRGAASLANVTMSGVSQIPEEGDDRRLLQRATNVVIVNDCGYGVFVSLFYTVGSTLQSWRWPNIQDGNALTISGVTDPTIWIYGVRYDWSSRQYVGVWLSSNSQYCYRAGDCFQTLELGVLNGNEVRYNMCGGNDVLSPNNVPKLPEPTLPPTRFPTILTPTPQPTPQPQKPTRPPTRSPELTPQPTPQPTPREQQEPNPTRPPTRPPTKSPTVGPTPAAATPTPQEPIPPESLLSGVDAEWLKEHNLRRTLFYSEHDLPPLNLKWTESIATSATNYAELLLELDGCSIQHGYGGNSDGGENLASNWGSPPWDVAMTPKEIMDSWYDEEMTLPELSQKYHATQVVFRSSHYVGCGSASKDMGDNGVKCFIHVCRYVSNGNCFGAGDDWTLDVLSEDQAFKCSGKKCEEMPEGCF